MVENNKQDKQQSVKSVAIRGNPRSGAGEASEAGQIIIEAIIAITICVVGLFGIFTLLSRSLSLNRVVGDQVVGANLASEGIELVKNMIDGNAIQRRPWNEGVNVGNYEIDYNDGGLSSSQNRFLSFDDVSGKYSYDSGSPTRFSRVVTIEQPSPDEIKAVSLVQWETRGGGDFEVELEDHFFNWR